LRFQQKKTRKYKNFAFIERITQKFGTTDVLAELKKGVLRKFRQI